MSGGVSHYVEWRQRGQLGAAAKSLDEHLNAIGPNGYLACMIS